MGYKHAENRTLQYHDAYKLHFSHKNVNLWQQESNATSLVRITFGAHRSSRSLSD